MQPVQVLIPITFFLSVAAVVVLAGPFGKAIAGAIASRIHAGRSPADLARAAQLELEIEHLKQRLAELEERQDFLERILAQQRTRGEVGAGQARQANAAGG